MHTQNRLVSMRTSSLNSAVLSLWLNFSFESCSKYVVPGAAERLLRLLVRSRGGVKTSRLKLKGGINVAKIDRNSWVPVSQIGISLDEKIQVLTARSR